MELSVNNGDRPATLQVDRENQSLVIKEANARQTIRLYPDTRIQAWGERITVGARVFTANAKPGQAPNPEKVAEFVRLLKQVAGQSELAVTPTSRTASKMPGQTRASGLNPPAAKSAELAPVSMNGLRHFRRAAGAARVIENISYTTAALSAIGGAVLAFQSRCDQCGFGEKYPYFAEGVALGIYGCFSSLFFAMIAAYIRARAAQSGA